MKLSTLCIQRPVFAMVLSLVVILVGLMAAQRLSIREYPAIDLPSVRVTTNYVGATADVIESQITSPMEDSLSGIEGIRQISSVTRDGVSEITMTFVLGRDAEDAAADVRDRVSRIRGRLPDDMDEPSIARVEADATPIYWLVVRSDVHSLAEITDTIDRVLRDPLQRIEGVAEAQIIGERRYAMRLWLDPWQMAARQITPQDLITALQGQNRDLPGGRIESQQREFSLRPQSQLTRPEEFDQMILRQGLAGTPDGLVRLQDIGRAIPGVEQARAITRYKGDAGVSIGIIRQSTANPLAISQAIRDLMPDLQARLPDGMSIETSNDTSVFIEESIRNVYSAIVEAVILVVLVIFVFLRNWRSVLIPLVTIPVSLIGVFGVLLALGYSINTLTLLAMVLAIGLVVDDAIVVMEHIYRYIEEGMKPLDAALKGIGEIAFAVIAITLALVAVYLPVAFLEGRTGRLFAEFALTLAGAVMISGFVALTLTPMMAARILRPPIQSANIKTPHPVLARLRNLSGGAYHHMLVFALGHRWLMLLLGGTVIGWIGLLYSGMKQELAPLEDRGIIFASAQAPEGASLDYTDAHVRQMEALFAKIQEANRYFVAAGRPTVTQMSGFIGLNHWQERTRSSQEIARALGRELAALPGLQAFPITPGPLGVRAFDKPVSMVILDNRPFDQIANSMNDLMQAISQNKNLVGVDHDLKINTPRLNIMPDRDRMAALGITPADIGTTLDLFYGNRALSRVTIAGEEYDVIARLAQDWRQNPEQLDQIFVRSPLNQQMVPLSSLIRVQEVVAPRELNHFNRQRAVTLSANLAPGYALGAALDDLEAIARKILPATTSLDYKGQSLEFREASGALWLTFLLALAFIYLVLAAQFESFVDPLVVLATVPLSLLGALLALRLSGGTLNIYSQIGLITLIGLIAKNGILIVEFTHQLRAQGLAARDAIIQAAEARLRPILMTALSMILGCVPLALADGAGAESRQAIGWTIIGGMTSGTLLTGLIVPVLLSFTMRDRKA